MHYITILIPVFRLSSCLFNWHQLLNAQFGQMEIRIRSWIRGRSNNAYFNTTFINIADLISSRTHSLFCRSRKILKQMKPSYLAIKLLLFSKNWSSALKTDRLWLISTSGTFYFNYPHIALIIPLPLTHQLFYSILTIIYVLNGGLYI